MFPLNSTRAYKTISCLLEPELQTLRDEAIQGDFLLGRKYAIGLAKNTQLSKTYNLYVVNW